MFNMFRTTSAVLRYPVFKYTLQIQMYRTCAYFADKVWSYVRCVAELSAHLQVADATDAIPELRQGVGACQQQSHVGSDVAKLRRKQTCHSFIFSHIDHKSD